MDKLKKININISNKSELLELISDILTIYCNKPFTGNFDRDVKEVYDELIKTNK